MAQDAQTMGYKPCATAHECHVHYFEMCACRVWLEESPRMYCSICTSPSLPPLLSPFNLSPPTEPPLLRSTDPSLRVSPSHCSETPGGKSEWRTKNIHPRYYAFISYCLATLGRRSTLGKICRSASLHISW